MCGMLTGRLSHKPVPHGGGTYEHFQARKRTAVAQSILTPASAVNDRPADEADPAARAATNCQRFPDAANSCFGAGDGRIRSGTRVAAVLDRNTRIQGTLQSEGNVLVEGSFDGDMEARETILVEKEASVKGHLLANDVIVSGLFDGEAVCQHRFRVTPGGSVSGQINTQVLVIEEGSTVNCRFTMARERRQP